MRNEEAGRHSAVCYIYQHDKSDFTPVQDSHTFRNSFGLDLFCYKGHIYEGQTGIRFCSESEGAALDDFIEKHGGLESVLKVIANTAARFGLSPRYTRPDEKKSEIFPPSPKDENIVFAKDIYGQKHYYLRFYNENGIELYTLKKQNEFFQTVFVPCEGFMVGIDQKHRLETLLKWLPTLENGIKGEIEKRFQSDMENPDRYADLGFANLLGRLDEARAHNAPIVEEHRRRSEQEAAAREQQRKQAEQERAQQYEVAIEQAEKDILAGKEVVDVEISGKSLLMQLFREHNIPVPLKTQGWIIHSLYSVKYDPKTGGWSYDHYGRSSTAISKLLPQLATAIQTKQQYEERYRVDVDATDTQEAPVMEPGTEYEQ